MAFDWNDNPLGGIKIEMPDSCNSKNHLFDLVVWGMCLPCGKTLGLVEVDQPVFKRLKVMEESV